MTQQINIPTLEPDGVGDSSGLAGLCRGTCLHWTTDLFGFLFVSHCVFLEDLKVTITLKIWVI